MKFSYKVCFYELNEDCFSKHVNYKNLNCLNFDSKLIVGNIQLLFEELSLNKADIVVVNLNGVDKERSLFVLNIIANNFCKNILLVGNQDIEAGISAYKLIIEDYKNFDLKLGVKLMDIKRDIESCPSKNILLLKNKVSNMLDDFQFSSRHDGFKYYIDAIILAYMKLPYDYHTMEIYKIVAEKYGKTLYAVEKSMRMALIHAFNKLRSAPQTAEYNELRAHLTYDLNNNTAISMMLNRLIHDNEIREDLMDKKEFLIRR